MCDLLPVHKRPRASTASPSALQSVACSRPLHPKLAQRSFLPDYIENATAALPDNRLEQLAKSWGLQPGIDRVVTVGTVCSGSELYMLSLEPLAKVLSATIGCRVSFRHMWACELNPKKRAWIRKHFCPEYLFADLKDVAEGKARDELTGRLVPNVPPVDVLISGFSCKDASRLNVHHTSRLDAVEKGTFSTGSTFGAFMRLVCT